MIRRLGFDPMRNRMGSAPKVIEVGRLARPTTGAQPKSAACVILDPAGDFAKEIMAWPEFNVGSRLIYIRHDLARGMVPAINPFDLSGIDPLNTSREAILGKRVAAQELLSALSIIIGGGQGADFSVNMERLLMPCLLTLFDRPGSTLLDLQRFMIESRKAVRVLCVFDDQAALDLVRTFTCCTLHQSGQHGSRLVRSV